MRIFKKITALVLVLLMCVGFAVFAFSEEDEGNNEVTCVDEYERGHGTVTASVSTENETETIWLDSRGYRPSALPATISDWEP